MATAGDDGTYISLLKVCTGYGKILYRDFIGIVFEYSPLSSSKSVSVPIYLYIYIYFFSYHAIITVRRLTQAEAIIIMSF